MKIKYGKQINIEEINETVDLFVLAGNHEQRVFSSLNKIRNFATINRTIMFCYKEFECPNTFSEIHLTQPSSHTDIYKTIESELYKIEKDSVVILVDYSCMTKSWYYSILLYLSNKKLKFKNITAYFCYTPSKFSPPQIPQPNTDIAPLPGKYIVPTDKPKALIVCLGYEQNKAEGIIDHLDPKISFIFYTKPALDTSFVSTIEENNKTVIANNRSTIITYPFGDLLYLERELNSLYYLLKEDYSIIIAPLGPKPFTFTSMVMAVKFKEIDIWRVGSGSIINEYPREPIPDAFIVSQIIWE